MIEDLLRAPGPIPVPPPPGFKPVVGSVSWAARSSAPPTLSGSQGPTTPSQRNGIRFEQRVHNYIKDRWGDKVELGPWFTFSDETMTRRWCQPDAIYELDEGTIIFEIKNLHTPNSWHQLRRLYEPVVEKVCGRPIQVCEVVGSYDPGVPFPEEIEMVVEWGDRLILPGGRFCVWVLRPEYMQ